MKTKLIISEEQLREIKSARKANQNKRIDIRLKALELRGEGKTLKEVSEITGLTPAYISRVIRSYFDEGLTLVGNSNYKGNRRNMTYEEEESILEPFTKLAEAGQIVSVNDIKEAYQKAVGHSIGGGQIYYVLRRHNWRKVMPRSRHPKKASEEVIATSKKLTLEFMN